MGMRCCAYKQSFFSVLLTQCFAAGVWCWTSAFNQCCNKSVPLTLRPHFQKHARAHKRTLHLVSVCLLSLINSPVALTFGGFLQKLEIVRPIYWVESSPAWLGLFPFPLWHQHVYAHAHSCTFVSFHQTAFAKCIFFAWTNTHMHSELHHLI